MDCNPMFSGSLEFVRCCRSCFRSEGLLEMVTRDECIELMNEVLQSEVTYPEHVWLCRKCGHDVKKLVRFRNNARQANVLFEHLMEQYKFGDSITSNDISELKSKLNNKEFEIKKCLNLNISHKSRRAVRSSEYGVIDISYEKVKSIDNLFTNEIPKCKETDKELNEPIVKLLVEINLKDVKLEEKSEIIDSAFSDSEFVWEKDEYECLQRLKTENVTENSVLNVFVGSPHIENMKYGEDSATEPRVKKKIKEIAAEPGKKKRKRGQEYDGIEMILLTKDEQIKEISDRLKGDHFLNAVYKCEQCAKIFSFEHTYQDHMRNHEKSYGPFVCDVCTIRTQTKYQAARHSVRHSRRYQCLVCGERRVKKDGALEHYGSAHGTPGARVCHCGKTFWKNSQYWHHRRTHTRVPQEKRLTCEHCGKTFKTKDTLRIHMVFHSDQPEKARPHKCPFCDARFHNAALMRIHRSKHADARDFYCVECDKGFKTDTALKQHIKLSAPHATRDSLKHGCATCEMRFASQRALSDHTHKVHLQTKPYRCDDCLMSFYQKWSLTLHKRNIHEGYKKPKKYVCATCGKGFTTNTLLKNHTRTHTGERPYACIHCAAAFSQNSSLSTHIKLVHLKMKLPPQRRRNAVKRDVKSDMVNAETHNIDCL